MKFLERFWFGCGHCHGGEGCPIIDDGCDPTALEKRELGHGLGLVLTVILVFILPLGTAIIGAMLADQWIPQAGPALAGTVQIGGSVIGFFVGVGLARLVFWTRRRFAPMDGGNE